MCADPIPLRPHHGLCIGFFTGYGYSAGFCRNMETIQAALREGTLIRLTSGHDVLCACCPNRDTPCAKAALYDRRTLELCGLSSEQVLPWEMFRHSIRESVLSKGRLSAVCGDCRWFGLCRGFEFAAASEHGSAIVHGDMPEKS